MNRAEKQALAQIVISHVAELVEDWEYMIETSPQRDVIKNVEGSEIAQTIANWLQHLPGEGWDSRLPMPAPSNKKEVS
jgi:hypothetical protein